MADSTEQLRERLGVIQDRLVARGVIDVKFHVAPDATPDQMLVDMVSMLEAILDGRTNPAAPIGDSQRLNA